MVTQHRGIGQVFVPQHENLLGVSNGRFNGLTQVPDPLPDRLEIGFQSLFEMAHAASVFIR
jgi:hypothetical protein